MTSQQDVEKTAVSLSEDPLLFGVHGEDHLFEPRIEKFLDQFDDHRGVLELSVEDFKPLVNKGVEEVIEHPKTFYYITKVARSYGYDDFHLVGEVPGAHQRIEDLRANDIGTVVSVECRITNRTDQYPRHINAVFTCLNCRKHSINVRQSWASGDIEYPRECPNVDCSNHSKKGFEHMSEMGDRVDRQQVIAQDLHAHASTPDPTDIRADLHNLLVNDVESGETVTLTAILRATEDATKDSALYLQVLGVEHHDRGYAGVELTDEDKARNEEIATIDDPYSRLAASIAPSIKGDYTLARMAGLYQLVGGVRRETDDQKERENIHVAYVGDPGTGKSDIAKYLAKIAPKSVYQSADNATEVGLTASISYEDKFDSTKATLTGGALVRADGGMCVIDELDKGSDGVRNCLQEPLEEQEVSVAKHDIRATLPTRCGALLVANPDNSRFDLHEPLKRQIDINDVIWDRMDVIVPFINSPDEERDNEIAESILNRAKGVSMDYLSPERMQKFVAHARTIDPDMTDEAGDIIHDWWVDKRSMSDSLRTVVGVRQFYSAVRLAEASARIRLSETVDTVDAERSIHMMDTWMTLLMTNENGQLDVDVLSGESAPKRKKKQVIKATIDGIDGNDGAHRGEVVDIVVRELNIDRTELQQEINSYIGNPSKSGVRQEDGLLFTGDFE